MWELLNNDDANGVITMYEVCYKASDTPTDITCDSKESVNGDTRELVLDSLNEATTYNVAVQAENITGIWTSWNHKDQQKHWKLVSIYKITATPNNILIFNRRFD